LIPAPTLRSLLDDATVGRFPPVDGGWTQIPPWRRGLGAVVAFTGHSYVALPGPPAVELGSLGLDGFGGAHAPDVVIALAGPGGWIDSLDVVLVLGTVRRRRSPSHHLVERPDLSEHPRVDFARRVRDDVVVFGLDDLAERSLVTLSTGLGGLPEIGIATDGGVDAVEMIAAAAALAGERDTIVASVAPGNARALRAFLNAGFTPVGSIQLFQSAFAVHADDETS
jgi:hypothetical protein